MKPTGFLLLVLLLAGCAKDKCSRCTCDPRTAIVGRAYLRYVAEYPPDRDTKYYYPSFTISDLQNWTDPTSSLQPCAYPQTAALLITSPAADQKVKDATGKGYPKLEQRGVPLFTASAQSCLGCAESK